jgi:hypothetical protein
MSRLFRDRAVSERFAYRLMVLCLAFSALTASAVAEDPRPAAGSRAKKAPAQPIVVVNTAGFDRLLGSADGLLTMVERPELSFALRGLLAVSTNGLKGIDHKRPFGVMTFINAGETPEPVGVVYVPVTTGPEFLASLKALEYSVKPATGLPGGYRVSAGKQEFAVLIRTKYAFLARSLGSLQRDFGDPSARFAVLSRDFDVCIRFQLDSTPAGLKAMVLDYVRASAEMGFEIRRGETVPRHKLRKAVGRAFLSGFEEIVRDGQTVTVGLKVSQDAAALQLEARLVARAGSPLANGLNDLKAAGKQTAVPPGPPSADFRFAANWKPPASLVPIFNAFVAALPKRTDGRADDATWRLLQRGLFATGIRLVAWSAGGQTNQPATLAVLSFPSAQAAASQVDGALAAFRARGIVRTENVTVVPKSAAQVRRVTWPAGTTAGAVAVLRSTAWVAVGRGKILTLLQQQMNAVAAPRRNPPKSLLRPGDLLHVAGNWSTLTSLLQGSVLPAEKHRASHLERFELTVTHKSNSLVLRAVMPPTAVRATAAPVLKRLLRR